MRCTEIEDLLDLYMDDELPDSARGRVERHLLRCAPCAFHLRSLEQTRALLRETCGHPVVNPSFGEKLAARLETALADVLRPEPAPSPSQRALPFPLH